ncbi:arf-GAP with GTPase, ANK repeat and PH domain-containing protein 1-like [Stegastes partitus]|uniref:Arf-GAP with GTPase, ANK repeat and PH domain-containing protein 1-like n=1 Tax=Stegastes partitus TaxID=144197 RepID=A0A9Y4KCC6_9TELE|nr:PREDICTED: arf-GAP with GTPase, ANK repeat and PH domain-containing protein 1-like [Stegastes partitus]
MSGGGALQQRTTYLISLTLVKVEAVEENGGEAKNGSQGKEVEAEGGAPARAENGAGVVIGQPQRAEDGGVVGKGGGDELKDGDRKNLSPLKDKLPPSGSEKPPCNLSIPVPAERIQKSVVEKTTPEAKQWSPTPSTPEAVEPSRTPTRTSLPIRPAGQRPVSLLKSHSSVATRGRDSREGRERSPTSAQSLDRKDCRVATRSPGPCRASWAEVSRPEGWRDLRDEAPGGLPLEIGGGMAAVMRDIPRKDRLKTGSTSLPAPPSQAPKPARKGKSRTLDNSDLNSLSEDLGLAREAQQAQQGQRGSAKDRKMLKFISGIFTKSSSGAAGSSSTAPPVYIQRDSSEEEGRDNISQHKISSTNPRVIEDQRARQLCIDVRHSLFYETCATYGFNVDRVFSEAAQKIVTQKKQAALQACKSLPNSPSHSGGSTPGSASFPGQSESYIYCVKVRSLLALNELAVLPSLLFSQGILGSPKSGKSALVNKYITGSYVALEKPDGGRYKKEVLVDGQSHLLLIREEPGPPDAQFSSWVDAVILVFSLENEASFQELYQLYSQLSSYRSDIPVIVVGTQGQTQHMDQEHLKIYVSKAPLELTCPVIPEVESSDVHEGFMNIANSQEWTLSRSIPELRLAVNGPGSGYAYSLPSTPVVLHRDLRVAQGEAGGSANLRTLKGIPRRPSLFKNRDPDKKAGDAKGDLSGVRGVPIKQSILWKRSGSSLNKEWKKKYVTLSNNGTLSYHSSSSDYTQNIHGKEIDLLRVTVKVPGKRPPRAVAPAGPSPVPPIATPRVNGLSKEPAAADNTSTVPQLCPATLSVVDDRSGGLSPQGGERGLQRCPSSLSTKAQSVDALEATASPFAGKDSSQSSPMSDRKKNRRKKSMNQKGDAAVGQAEEEENADFIIVSFTGQTWHFEAPSLEERDSWVSAIESQILASLQSCESGRNKARRSSQSEAVALQAIRNAKGNGLCVDCEAPNPTWASLNLGALICIECSGIHRNLGTHLSRVRSLDLDDWPGELTQVLAAIGNHMANSIWESCTQGRTKPAPNATREERESWIRAKYEQRAFVPPLPPPSGNQPPDDSMPTWLLAAVNDRDLPRLLLLLAHSSKDLINAQPAGSPSPRSALHAACQLGDVVMTQLLVWYGIDVRAKDSQGQTAMMMARKTGSKGCMDILLQHGCPSETSPTASAATPILARRSSTASLGRTSSRKRVS